MLLREDSGGRPEVAEAAAEGELLLPDGDTVLLRGERPLEWWPSPFLNPEVTLEVDDPFVLIWGTFPFPTTEFLGLGPTGPSPLEARATAGDDSRFKFPGMFHTHLMMNGSHSQSHRIITITFPPAPHVESLACTYSNHWHRFHTGGGNGGIGGH